MTAPSGASGARAGPGARGGDPVRDQRIDRLQPLPSPQNLLDELPLGEERTRAVVQARRQMHAIIHGHDDRLLVVVGPCSVHDPEATLEYAGRLREQALRLQEDLLVTMRVYFEKPRTTTGWKGLINDPHLDDSGDVNAGLRVARQVLLGVLSAGLPAGCEFLDPFIPQYISDAVSWGAIGARTVESQTHRQLGSGLSMPVGFKNRTDGNVQVAADALRAAAVPQAFAGISPDGVPAVMYTRGNPDCHLILRGGHDGPNYGQREVARALAVLRASGLPERAMIDCSHDNSGKDADRQPAVAADVAGQIASGNRGITGVMLESFLVGGRQKLDAGALTYGQSITDACLDWARTVEVLEELAGAVRTRRCASPS